jgi:hypothetical protein
LGGIGQLRQQVTVETLPDDVLLNIFKLFVNAMELDGSASASDEWHLLVHVCRRWRYLAFTSPRHLNLQLLCKIPGRSVEEMLDIWPQLPVYVEAIGGFITKEERDDCIAALGLNRWVSGIRLEKTSRLAFETLLPLMQHPSPALTHLTVQPENSIANEIMNGMSRSFLGGSSRPSLRVLDLVFFPFPALPELLLSATNLVRLWYDDIPRSGYISPQAMVTALSGLIRLESLSLTFQSSYSHPGRSIQITPLHARTLLPALTYLRFQCDAEYMEDLVAQIDTPMLESLMATIFRREVLEVSQFSNFVRRADKLSSLNQAEVAFRNYSISLNISQGLHRIGPKTLVVSLLCLHWALQLSYFARFCASCLPTYSFEHLLIYAPIDDIWVDDMNGPDPQWVELLRSFHAVKDLRLSRDVAAHITHILRRLPVELVSEVLPALETVFVSALGRSGRVEEAISEFADARQFFGHPVSICDGEEKDHNILEDILELL